MDDGRELLQELALLNSEKSTLFSRNSPVLILPSIQKFNDNNPFDE